MVCMPCIGEGGGQTGQLPVKKYGSRKGNEPQWKEEAVCLLSVFKRVLNVVLSGMANLIIQRVFAVVFGEMFATVFHGDCVWYKKQQQESL